MCRAGSRDVVEFGGEGSGTVCLDTLMCRLPSLISWLIERTCIVPQSPPWLIRQLCRFRSSCTLQREEAWLWTRWSQNWSGQCAWSRWLVVWCLERRSGAICLCFAEVVCWFHEETIACLSACWPWRTPWCGRWWCCTWGAVVLC